MSLYQDGSGLPSKNHYTDEDLLRKYETAISDSFSIVFGENDGEKFGSYAHKIVAFEKSMKAAEMDPEDIQDETKTYFLYSIIRSFKATILLPFPTSLVHSRMFRSKASSENSRGNPFPSQSSYRRPPISNQSPTFWIKLQRVQFKHTCFGRQCAVFSATPVLERGTLGKTSQKPWPESILT